MSRYVDADALECDTEWSEYHDGFMSYSQLEIDTAPSIKTKEVKYFDEDEKVWKIGEVIVSDSEKPNNLERSSE